MLTANAATVEPVVQEVNEVLHRWSQQMDMPCIHLDFPRSMAESPGRPPAPPPTARFRAERGAVHRFKDDRSHAAEQGGGDDDFAGQGWEDAQLLAASSGQDPYSFLYSSSAEEE